MYPPGDAESEIAKLNRQLDALASRNRPRDPNVASAVDNLIAEARAEYVEEVLDAARAARLDEELGGRVRGPTPDFDARFGVPSNATEYESGPTETEQVAGVRDESFRLAVDPGTMQPVEGASDE
jgi:hypothetical protein